MDAGLPPAGVGVPNQPYLAVQVPLEHEHMAAPRRDHAGRWGRSRKAQPVRRDVQPRDDPAEDMERGTAAAVSPRAASRATADNAPRPFGHDAVKCQSARKFDPVSAFNFDPFARRGLRVALDSSELAGIAETRRARVA